MSNFKDKKTKKNKLTSKTKIIPFKTKTLKDQKIETEQEIWKKIDSFSLELVEAFKEKTYKESIDPDHCWYLFYYRVKQEMMLKMSYPAFKYYSVSVERQLLRDHKEFMNSLDEWTANSSDDEDLFGRSKIIKKDKTLH